MWLVMKNIVLLQEKKMEQLSKLEKQKKTKVKNLTLKRIFFLEKGKVKVNLLKIKLIIDMLYVAYIQFNFSNLKSCLKKLSATEVFYYSSIPLLK